MPKKWKTTATAYETRTLKMREQIEAMKRIWDARISPSIYGEIVNFAAMHAWPKPAQRPHPPVIVGGAFRLAARRAIRYGRAGSQGLAAPAAGSGSLGGVHAGASARWPRKPAVTRPRFRRSPCGGAPEDLAVLRRNRDLGVSRMNVRLPPEKEDVILPILDRWAKLYP